MAVLEYFLVMSLMGITGFVIFKAAESKSKQQRLTNAFYRLLEDKDSCVSLIQLSATARVEPQLAKQYLDEQVKIFAAFPEVDNDGNTYYRFPRM
ncbi:hypothetical protein ACE1B6_06165 [Aerosakkonemataceae cyanobacterium BLCC-F154]|uniref:Type II secretion system protein n=1 Tax=Floridaenema fluviatile BLCC-F154 TaxID=3153640 RepID=A0ABV4YAD0_9CYAN